MDTTKEYIKMCEKAKEIQKLWIDKTIPEVSERATIFSTGEDYGMPEWNKTAVWTPSQGQLQEIAKGIYRKDAQEIKIINIMLLNDFQKWVLKRYPVWLIKFNFNSFEQLWLGFVMCKLYLKQWDGEDWKLDKGDIN